MSTPGMPPPPAGPIGVYDSGVGGLSVLKALRARLPGESFVYVADSGHAPYGSRSPAFIAARAHAVADFLVRGGAQALVLACNTVSVVAAGMLRARHALPIVAMEPAIKPALALTQSKAILVLATPATLESRAVQALCRRFGGGVDIVLQACPGWVEWVERGAGADAASGDLLARCLRPGLAAGADTIVLGCTHYAFLTEAIAAFAGPSVRIVEPSDAIARRLAWVLGASAARPGRGAGATTFYTSGALPALRSFLARTGEPAADVRPLP